MRKPFSISPSLLDEDPQAYYSNLDRYAAYLEDFVIESNLVPSDSTFSLDG
jgi:hypothetical protein